MEHNRHIKCIEQHWKNNYKESIGNAKFDIDLLRSISYTILPHFSNHLALCTKIGMRQSLLPLPLGDQNVFLYVDSSFEQRMHSGPN